MRIEVRRAGERYRGGEDGITSRYAFSFANHYDPDNVHFGPLLAVNEEHIQPGAGFAQHRHRDTEIVTWVLEGALEHRDSSGRRHVVRPGTVQRMSAGAGVLHTERNTGTAPVRFLQMWLQPDAFGGESGTAVAGTDPGATRLVLASGMEQHRQTAAVTLRRADAALHLIRSGPTATPLRGVPEAPYVYLHTVRGQLHLPEPGGAVHVLGAGDSARITDAEWLWPAVGPDGAELLVWEAHSGLLLG